jgi:hypothetical protein
MSLVSAFRRFAEEQRDALPLFLQLLATCAKSGAILTLNI